MSSRSGSFIDWPRLLEAMGACRKAITDELSRMEVNGALYCSASAVTAAIDGLALMLTGKRDYFWEKGSCPAPRKNVAATLDYVSCKDRKSC